MPLSLDSSNRFLVYRTPLIGDLTLVTDPSGRALAACLFEQDRHYGPARELQSRLTFDPAPVLRQASAWLDAYFAGERPSPRDLPLAPQGSAFQHSVWDVLADIPYGATTTYGAIARLLEERLGRRQSSQAVGGAVGRNPVCVIVPCHRVIGSDGSLTGFGGGLPLKRALLAHEGVALP